MLTAAQYRWVCAATVVVQLVVLYWPRAGSGGAVAGLDKVVHVAVFAAVGTSAVLAGARAGLVLMLLLGHAVVSELVQAGLLTQRSGDPWDVVADAVGAALGVALGLWLGVAHTRRSGR